MVVQCITLQARTCPAWYFFCFCHPFFPWKLQFRQLFWQAVFSLASALECLFGTFCFYQHGQGSGGVAIFLFFQKQCGRKDSHACITWLCGLPGQQTRNRRAIHTEELDDMMLFLYEMFFFFNTCTAEVVHFLSFSPHVLFLEQGQIFRRKGNVYLNECTSVEVLKAPPEGYFTERKLMMQKFGSGNSRQGFKSNKTTHLQTKEQNAQGNLEWQERKNDKLCRPSRSWRQKVLEFASSTCCSS